MTNKQMTAQEQIAMLRDALKQFQYAAHEILSTQSDKMRLAAKMGDSALNATNQPPEAEVDERDEFERFAKIYGSLMMEREGPGYLFRDTHISWISWQARAALKGGK